MTDPAYDEWMADVDVALVAVTATDGVERAGCLVGFHTQCSIDPPRHIVWLSRANHTYRVALFAEVLGVHLLGVDHRDLALALGHHTGDEEPTFDGIEVVEGPHGVPMLAAVAHRFVGRRVAVLDTGGDHVGFVLDVSATHIGDEPCTPLRASDVEGVAPGHEATDRPTPRGLGG
ncbi:flavin reductase family protein [Mariniluteicoccus flavus]